MTLRGRLTSRQQLLTTPRGQLLTTPRLDRWQSKDFRTLSRFRAEARRLRIEARMTERGGRAAPPPLRNRRAHSFSRQVSTDRDRPIPRMVWNSILWRAAPAAAGSTP